MARPRSSDSTTTEQFPEIPDVTRSPNAPVQTPPINTRGPTSTLNLNVSTSPTTSHHAAGPAPASPSTSSTTPKRVDYALNTAIATSSSPRVSISTNNITRTDSNHSHMSIKRRVTRANTFKTIDEFDEPGWHPGAEPGIDLSKPHGGDAPQSELQAECQITIVDFSQEHLQVYELDNAQMIEFVQKPQPSWAKCRWINVNGLSFDVISALGRYKNLHSLALEDVLSPRNRTKADWYSHHAYLVLTCLKLCHDRDADDSDDEDGDNNSVKSWSSTGSLKKSVQRWWSSKKMARSASPHLDGLGNMEKGARTRSHSMGQPIRHKATGFSDIFNPDNVNTLQRFRASPNNARTGFMEDHHALNSRGLFVMAEQVSLFITSDNTVVCIWEQSADDVEIPILKRLRTPDTILRQSCDASMIAQSIIDAIIDMAMPIASTYADVIGDYEIDVLTHPNIKLTRNLYICKSEMNKMLSLVAPIGTLISTLRDHKTNMSQESATKELQNPDEGVIITPKTYIYLADVYDHTIQVIEELSQLKESASNLIDLVFNQIAAAQNDKMKQLTAVTIIFLPMTFITGYFGQNFQPFSVLQEDVVYFWKIAIPVAVATVFIIMGQDMWNWLIKLFQRRQITTLRENRKKYAAATKRLRRLNTMNMR